MAKKMFSVFLCWSILWSQVASTRAQKPQETAQEPQTWNEYLKKPYLEIMDLSLTAGISKETFESVRHQLEKQQKEQEDMLKREIKNREERLKNLRKDLNELSKKNPPDPDEGSKRTATQCEIRLVEAEIRQTKLDLAHGIKVEYDNYNAKLNLLENWPAEKQGIESDLASGRAQQRKWGDVLDIGFREIEQNQEDDIARGQEAVNQMKQMGLLPKEIEDPKITEYINRIAQNIARSSDLKVPLRLTVLNSKEINAYALPGGFLFVNRGLIEAAESESQLAGVLAHEISHVVARHGQKMMKRAAIAGLIFQAAQVAAIILTGGAAGIGAYYALQYGFQGLGLLISLQILGISRDYEIEADILGTQYAWNAGYNTEGFITFFDIMASKEGYAEKTSFFRTHPAFYERIVAVSRERAFLTAKNAVEDTAEFQEIKKQLRDIAATLDKEEKDKPTLYKQDELNCQENTGQN